MNHQDFGLRLKELRLSRELTQTQLANKIGISRQAYVTYETGRSIPPAEVVAKLSKAFDTDLMEMFFNHSSTSFMEANALMLNIDRKEFFSLLESYSRLSPTSQKRIHNLIRLMQKGGDE